MTAAGNSFSATSRSSFVSRARYTSPIPPLRAANESRTVRVWRRLRAASLELCRLSHRAHPGRSPQATTAPRQWEQTYGASTSVSVSVLVAVLITPALTVADSVKVMPRPDCPTTLMPVQKLPADASLLAVLDAVEQAIYDRCGAAPDDLVHHSDRGRSTCRCATPIGSPRRASRGRSGDAAIPTICAGRIHDRSVQFLMLPTVVSIIMHWEHNETFGR